uniref:NADH dehydrogenase [ubiquinone] 1 alpha subcomplex subunit 11 n=1 Tax=Amblyomma maculatum TaxID=34609 RepID=G3MS29_AMBMU
MVASPNEFPLLYMYEQWQNDRKKRGIQPFSYYRTRADDEGLEKLTYFSLYSLKYGALAGVVDAVTITEATRLSQYLGRIAFWSVPAMGSCGAFLATNHFLTKFTGKDDWQTHAIGGIAAASVWGGKFQSLKLGFSLSLVLAVWCALRKWSIDNNIQLAGRPPKHGEYLFLSQQYDMSIIKSP